MYFLFTIFNIMNSQWYYDFIETFLVVYLIILYREIVSSPIYSN